MLKVSEQALQDSAAAQPLTNTQTRKIPTQAESCCVWTPNLGRENK